MHDSQTRETAHCVEGQTTGQDYKGLPATDTQHEYNKSTGQNLI